MRRLVGSGRRGKWLTGSETLDERGSTCVLEDLSEELSSGSQVGGPAEPSGVASIQVHEYTDSRELLECVVDGRLQMRNILDSDILLR